MFKSSNKLLSIPSNDESIVIMLDMEPDASGWALEEFGASNVTSLTSAMPFEAVLLFAPMVA